MHHRLYPDCSFAFGLFGASCDTVSDSQLFADFIAKDIDNQSWEHEPEADDISALVPL
jgi:hypothetical protein